jgi:hypothetical protein
MSRTGSFLRVALLMLCGLSFAAKAADDPAHIDIYVTPYYNSSGPEIQIGRYSEGLASKSETTFLSTIQKMKSSWSSLNFIEQYVAAIRLYELGYRKESTYWFYTAQYRGRQFGMLRNPGVEQSIGEPGFELLQAHNSFYQLAGPYINGYAFGDLDSLAEIIRRVQKEGKAIQDLHAIYPQVSFRNQSEWTEQNDGLNAGLSKLLAMLTDKKDEIKQQRAEKASKRNFRN